MRLAVIADIHGNAVALDAVLADLARRAADRLVCLGDAVQGGPEPAEVVARLRAVGCPVVMGNADAWLLTGVETGDEPMGGSRRAMMQAVREWSLSRLSAADREFIAAFTPTVRVPLDDGRALLAYHGSPASFDEKILPTTPEDEFRRMVGAHADAYLAGGHVHLQFVRHVGGTFHFNPGSVGVAYRHDQSREDWRLDPWAEYALLECDGDRVGLEFHRVPLDLEAVFRAFRESGRPHAEDMIRMYAPAGVRA